MDCKNEPEVGHFVMQDVSTSAPSFDPDEINIGGKSENLNFKEETKSGKKRKTRRFKNRIKSKNTPYCRMPSERREKIKKTRSTVYPQSEAPNNTTQFLMAYHHDLENLDDRLLNEVEKKLRAKDNSLTSIDSDEDGHFYSSPEEEKEFLSRDFCNTYTRIQEEELTSLPMSELIQIIIGLEDRVDDLKAKLRIKNRIGDITTLLQNETSGNDAELKQEVKQLLIENERLHDENEKLRQIIDENMESSSSSSSSCDDSDHCLQNGDIVEDMEDMQKVNQK